MKLFTALKCTSNLPDDQIEDGDKIVQPGGRSVAYAVAELLQGAGMGVSNPTLDDEHGWAFTASANGMKYWVLVTDLVNEKLIQTKDVSPIPSRIFRRDRHYAKFLNGLQKLLSDDGRFRAVDWFSYRN